MTLDLRENGNTCPLHGCVLEGFRLPKGFFARYEISYVPYCRSPFCTYFFSPIGFPFSRYGRIIKFFLRCLGLEPIIRQLTEDSFRNTVQLEILRYKWTSVEAPVYPDGK
jgi:hypothetical protein